MKNIHKIGKELFITSDEKIKEGDYVQHTQMFNHIGFTGIAKVGKQQVNQEFEMTSLDGKHSYYSCKEPKIILTIDKDLIKDGVQAIDDDFLEWYVKNPSCEWVEIEEVYPLICCIQKEGKTKMNNGCMERNRCLHYKIIIPSEELKQDYSGVHFTHCYQGKYEDGCKYGEDDLKEAFKGGGRMSWTDINQETQEPYYYDFNEWFEQFKKK